MYEIVKWRRCSKMLDLHCHKSEIRFFSELFLLRSAFAKLIQGQLKTVTFACIRFSTLGPSKRFQFLSSGIITHFHFSEFVSWRFSISCGWHYLEAFNHRNFLILASLVRLKPAPKAAWRLVTFPSASSLFPARESSVVIKFSGLSRNPRGHPRNSRCISAFFLL